MPEIGRIQSTNFQALLSSLGIVRNDVPFALRSEVTPVVLVGGTVSFVAAPTPSYALVEWFTAGEQVAPGAGTVLADTGQLPVGSYTVKMMVYCQEPAEWHFQWRNAANSADLRSQIYRTASDFVVVVDNFRLSIETANERFRVVNLIAGGAGLKYQASIFAKV